MTDNTDMKNDNSDINTDNDTDNWYTVQEAATRMKVSERTLWRHVKSGKITSKLEHGIRFSGANVTNNHPILTGQIVLAHFYESLDYYKRLTVFEIEGDLLKAVSDRNTAKIEALYRQLLKAKLTLIQAESDSLK